MAKSKEKKAKVSINSIEDVLGMVNKKYGDGSLQYGVTSAILPCKSISTGATTLDKALGVGGVPRGRMVEIYGPESSGKTTLALTIVAQAQKEGGTAAFIDAEHALDKYWANNLGVDITNLAISQPDSGEQALDICELLVRSGKFDVIVIDSVAALTPQCEIDEDSGSTMGAQARMISQSMRKLCSIVSKSDTCVIWINQIRMKIGVMFGCLHGETLVNFADGRSIPIKEVVDNRIGGAVWSYDVDNNKFVAREIVDWHHNGDVTSPEDYLSIALTGPGTKNGTMNITVTPNHKVLTNDGWIEAKDLNVGSMVVTKQESIISGTVGEFLRGVLSGDSHIRKNGNHISANLQIRDNIDPEYAKWKVSKLQDYMDFRRYDCKFGYYYMSRSFSELSDAQRLYPNRDPMILLDNFSWCGFAIWIMDDAVYNRGRYHLSIKRFKGDYEKIEQISKSLDDIGLYHHASYGGRIIFDKDVSDKISSEIAKFVPGCMSRKLPDEHRNKYCEFMLNKDTDYSRTFAAVTSIRPASDKQMRMVGKYDLSIEGTKCYSVGNSANGVIVHNSPEVTPGGKAIKFYSSVRIDVRKTETIKKGNIPIGQEVKARVVKNKVAPPFEEAMFTICFGRPEQEPRPIFGIDYFGSLIEMASELEILESSGAWMSYKGTKLGNGKGAVGAFLADNPEIADAIKKEVMEHVVASRVISAANTQVAQDDGFEAGVSEEESELPIDESEVE